MTIEICPARIQAEMKSARIAELLKPFFATAGGETLSNADLDAISTYIDLLLRWNARINLTAIRDPEEIVARHFGESFFAARHLFPERQNPMAPSASAFQASAHQLRLADLGSGAGFPGIPIKLWAREVSLTLIESNQKKAVFLREVCRSLKLNDVEIENARAEKTGAPRFDMVTLRAVERFGSVLPVAANLVRPGGQLILLISSAQAATAKSLLTDFHWGSPVPIPLSESRVLFAGASETAE
jgi:16S rRNA (guanine527-N7)-methyltransferase